MEIPVEIQSPCGEVLVVVCIQGQDPISTEVVAVFEGRPVSRDLELRIFNERIDGPGTVLQELVFDAEAEFEFLPEYGLSIDLIGQVGNIQVDGIDIRVRPGLKILLDQAVADFLVKTVERGIQPKTPVTSLIDVVLGIIANMVSKDKVKGNHIVIHQQMFVG